MVIIGLTGSIGMGKSTTASLFREAGIPVHDSDAAVHQLYFGDGARAIEEAFPGVAQGGVVDRAVLASRVLNDPHELKRLEALVHPLIAKERSDFIEAARKNGEKVVLLDIPLLFETGADKNVDFVAVVTAPKEIQKERVMARPGMTEEKFDKILSRQLPDAEKRKRANFIIDTSSGIENARLQALAVIAEVQRDPKFQPGQSQ